MNTPKDSSKPLKVQVVKMPDTKSPGIDKAEADSPVRAEFNFREKGKVQPKGYKGLAIDTEVTVTIKGTVKSVGSRWGDNSPQFSIDIASCDIVPKKAKPVSLSDALDSAQQGRKKVS